MTARPIVTFSSIDWDYVWQGHQEVMSRLAAAGHPVLFVENTGLRRPRLADSSRIWKRASALAATSGEGHTPTSGLTVLAPRVLPLPYSRPAVAFNRWMLEPSLRRWLAGFSEPPIVWTYLPTPLVRSLVARLSPALFVYYCVDDLPASSDSARPVAAGEREVFRTADLVFATSDRLRQKALACRSEVHVFPPGVSYERFAAAREHHGPAPDEVRGLQRPVVGYVGGLHRWFDVPLAAAVARRLPHVQFLFIGPVQVPVDSLTSLPNVHVIGPRAHDTVPAYLGGLDAGIIPYVLDEYTASVFPTKMNEYLAMGLPVVSTPIAEVVSFRDRHGAVVEVAGTADAFAAAVERAVAEPRSPATLDARYAVAKAQGWDVRVAGMRQLMASALAARPGGGAR